MGCRLAPAFLVPVLLGAHSAQAGQAAACPAGSGFDALVQTGLGLSRRGDYPAAADCYRKASALNPKALPVQLNLALAEFKQGRFRAAIDPLLAALALDPGNVQASILLGMSYYGSGRFAESIPLLDAARARDPRNLQLRYVLAQSCLWSGKYDRALTEFEALEREQPDSAPVHMLVAQALDGMGSSGKAIEEMQAAVAASPSEPNVHFGLGYLLWKSLRYEEAAVQFRAELAHDSMHAKACAWLADSLIKLEKAAEAKPWLDKALELNPDLRLARLDRGILCAEDKRYDCAISELKHAARLDPSRSDAHYRLARVYRQAGRAEEAKAEMAILARMSDQKMEDALHKVSSAPPALDAR